MVLVPYEDYSEESAAADISELARTPFFKFDKGNNVVRFVPARKGEQNFFTTHSHYLGDTEKGVGINCPRAMSKGRKKCPICEVAKRLTETGDPDDEARGKKLWPRRRVYGAVIDRENPDVGVQIVAFGSMIHEDLARLRKDTVAGGNFIDPVNGFDLNIEKKGEGLQTRYTIRRIPDRSPLVEDEDEINTLISEQPDKSKHGQLMDFDAIIEATAEWVPEYGALGITSGPAVTGAGGSKALPASSPESSDFDQSSDNASDDNIPF